MSACALSAACRANFQLHPKQGRPVDLLALQPFRYGAQTVCRAFKPLSQHSPRTFLSTCTAAAPAQTAGSPGVDSSTALPATYRRLVAQCTGESFREVAQVEEVQLKLPGEGEVLIKVLYAGVNGGCETFRARGDFAFARNKAADFFLLGAEGAGVVVAVGPGITGFTVGQHVTCVGAGAFAEYVTAKASLCWPLSEATAETVALTISGVTAAVALEVTGGMKPTDTVLVTAGAGATGHFAVQLALLAGCQVVATCGGSTKAAALRQLGTHRVIDYHAEDVGQVLQDEYPAGIDLAYEGAGGALRRTVIDRLSPEGRLLAVGYISEYPHATQQDCGDAHSGSAECTDERDEGTGAASSERLFWERMTIQLGGRTIYGDVWPRDRSEVVRCKRRLFDLYEAGRINAWIDSSRSFHGVDEVADAVEYMLSGKAIGKVVVRL